jgi:hypothetical protein
LIVDTVEQRLHVGECVDRDPNPSDIINRLGIVGIESELRREIERDRDSSLALLQQPLVALIRFFGCPETAVLAHRPDAPAIHCRLHAAREGIFAG